MKDVIITGARKLDLSNFINIPGTNIAIASVEPDYSKGTEGYTWENSHFAIAERDTWMPTIWRFMPHLVNVIQAQKGNQKAYDGNGNQLDSRVLGDAYLHRVSSHINGGAWSHLNGMFVSNNQGFKKLGIKYVVGVDLDARKLSFEEVPLEECVFEDCFVELDGLNSQGLPRKKSHVQEYSRGDNLGYGRLYEGGVAWFSANSGWAYLGCSRNPLNCNASLGVLVCAEGAAPKVSQAKLK